ncbi:hypothetical protein [Salinarimonas chemoclinalis]|uniref:hypothetical protein n=1 Tax=Salinarimonas chemoclinalis TaxID=3241599 RepID=UPI0035569157
MSLRDTPRFPTVVVAGLVLAAMTLSARADDPPREDAVLDAMPFFTGTIGAADGGEGALDRPNLGDRPTPAEARRRGEADETLMRPRGGSATGGEPDFPLER